MLTATLPKTERRNAPAIRPDWREVLKTAELEIDPLADWREAFRDWIFQVSEFRKMESDVFFKNTKEPTFCRIHRGWACNLIANGEVLAIEIAKVECSAKDRDKQLLFLDTFMKNIQSTIATWHGFDRDEEANPLQKYFA